MRENIENKEEERDPVQIFVENEAKPYRQMIEEVKRKIEAIDQKQAPQEIKEYEKKIYTEYIKDIEQKIHDIKTGGVEIINHFKSLDSHQRDDIMETSEKTIKALKEEMEKLETEGNKETAVYAWKGGMRSDYESQLRMLMAIKEGKL